METGYRPVMTCRTIAQLLFRHNHKLPKREEKREQFTPELPSFALHIPAKRLTYSLKV